MKRSRLKKSMSPARRQRLKTGYHVTATMLSPDHVMFDLYHKDQWIRTLGELDPSDVHDRDLDRLGRLKPEVIWKTLVHFKDYVKDAIGVIPKLPPKHEIVESRYGGVSR